MYLTKTDVFKKAAQLLGKTTLGLGQNLRSFLLKPAQLFLN
jgi:hypothetical protein